MLVRKGYQRMLILQKLYSFRVSTSDLVNIYILYIRSLLEQSCQVWHFSITEEEKIDLERVQKVACKVILKGEYETYPQALDDLNLQTLSSRRETLCLKFAKKCIKHEKAKHLFPLNLDHRNKDKYKVQFARKDRLMYSTIPQLQRLLNADASK